jgi:hypothetical protein
LADQKQPLGHLGGGRFFLPPNFFYFLAALDRAAVLCYNSHWGDTSLSVHFAGSGAPTLPRLFLYSTIFRAENQVFFVNISSVAPFFLGFLPFFGGYFAKKIFGTCRV